MRRQLLIMLGALLALGALLRITPPAKGQYFPPALPGTFGDIATPSVPPPAGATRVYTKNGTACALSPLSVETCTGSGGGGGTSTITPYQSSAVINSLSIATPANVRAGDTLILGACTNTATSVGDTLGNNFTKVNSIAGANGNLTSLWSVKSPTGGADTITVTGTVGNCEVLTFLEVEQLTGTAEANATSNTNVATVTSLTAGALIVAVQSGFSNATALSNQAPLFPTGPTSSGVAQSLNLNGSGALSMGYYTAGAAGTYPGQILSSASAQDALIVASFPHS